MLDRAGLVADPAFRVVHRVEIGALVADAADGAGAGAAGPGGRRSGPGPALPSPRQTEAQFAAQCASVPLGRGTAPMEVARAVLALLSLPSVTGQMIALDGGQHLQWSPARGRGVDE